MGIISSAQITREINQLKKILTVYYKHNLTEMVDDVEQRIVELESLLNGMLERGGYRRMSPGSKMHILDEDDIRG